MRIDAFQQEAAVGLRHGERQQRLGKLPPRDIEKDALGQPLARGEGVGERDGDHADLAGAREAHEEGLMGRRRRLQADGCLQRGRCGAHEGAQFVADRLFPLQPCGFPHGGLALLAGAAARLILMRADQRLDDDGGKILPPADGAGVVGPGRAQDAQQRPVGDGFRAHEEDGGDIDRLAGDEEGRLLRHLRAARERGDGLPARLVAGGRIERLEELAELVKVGFPWKTQALEAGDRGHQHDVLRPPGLRSLQFAKPVRHETPVVPTASPSAILLSFMKIRGNACLPSCRALFASALEQRVFSKFRCAGTLHAAGFDLRAFMINGG